MFEGTLEMPRADAKSQSEAAGAAVVCSRSAERVASCCRGATVSVSVYDTLLGLELGLTSAPLYHLPCPHTLSQALSCPPALKRLRGLTQVRQALGGGNETNRRTI